MSDLYQYTKEELQRRFDEKNAQWLYNLARGIDLEAVTPRLVPKSISCSKMFPRQNAIADLPTLKHWLHEIAKDVVERVEEDEQENNRRPKQMVVSYTQCINDNNVASSRSVNFTSNDEDKIVNDAIDVMKKNTPKFLKPNEDGVLSNRIIFLGFNICKFDDSRAKGCKTIGDMFRKSIQKKEEQTATEVNNESLERTSEPNISNVNYNNKSTTQELSEEPSSFLEKYDVQFMEDVVTSTDDEDDSDINNSPQTEALAIAANLMNQNLQNHLLETPPHAPTSTKVDYRSSYAEYYKPSVENVPKKECSHCGKMVLVSQMQVHTDAHLAFQLNEEQRTEFQNQLKRTHSTNTPQKKKQKTASNNKATVSSIQKFLVKKRDRTPEPEPCTSTANDVEYEKCAECGKHIAITKLFEHMDFHAAKRIQDELMKTETKIDQTNNNSKSSTNKNMSLAKGKKSTKKKANSKNPAVRNITSFFQNI